MRSIPVSVIAVAAVHMVIVLLCVAILLHIVIDIGFQGDLTFSSFLLGSTLLTIVIPANVALAAGLLLRQGFARWGAILGNAVIGTLTGPVGLLWIFVVLSLLTRSGVRAWFAGAETETSAAAPQPAPPAAGNFVVRETPFRRDDVGVATKGQRTVVDPPRNDSPVPEGETPSLPMPRIQYSGRFDADEVGRRIEAIASSGARGCLLPVKYSLVDNLLDVVYEPAIVSRPNPPLTASECRELFEALSSLHEHGIIHGNITERAVVRCSRDDVSTVALYDYGFSADESLSAIGQTLVFAPRLDIVYLAPERLGGDPPSEASDVYAMACTCAELILGRPLFLGGFIEILQSKHEVPEAINSLSNPIQEVFRVCLNPSAEERPTASEVARQLRTVASEPLNEAIEATESSRVIVEVDSDSTDLRRAIATITQPVTLGRGNVATLHLEHPAITRLHATVGWDAPSSRFRFWNNGSNTFHEGRAMGFGESLPIEDSLEVRLGHPTSPEGFLVRAFVQPGEVSQAVELRPASVAEISNSGATIVSAETFATGGRRLRVRMKGQFDRLAVLKRFAEIASVKHPLVLVPEAIGHGDLILDLFYALDGEAAKLEGITPSIFAQGFEALSAYHDQGVIHGEITSQSLILRHDIASNDLSIRLFGGHFVTKAAAEEELHHTADCALPSLAHLSALAPELLDSQQSTSSSDVYALAAVLAEAYLRKPLFGEKAVEILQRKCAPLDVDELRPLQPDVAELILTCLDRVPAQRPSASLVAKQLRG
ncbi:MAG: protein kinase domain-containing protein [Thermoanaerobaculia bacterium]